MPFIEVMMLQGRTADKKRAPLIERTSDDTKGA